MPFINRNKKSNEIIGVFANKQYKNQEFIEKLPQEYLDKQEQIANKMKAYEQLKQTDIKVMRHFEEEKLGIETTLSAEIFTELLNQRKLLYSEIK